MYNNNIVYEYWSREMSLKVPNYQHNYCGEDSQV